MSTHCPELHLASPAALGLGLVDGSSWITDAADSSNFFACRRRGDDVSI